MLAGANQVETRCLVQVVDVLELFDWRERGVVALVEEHQCRGQPEHDQDDAHRPQGTGVNTMRVRRRAGPGRRKTREVIRPSYAYGAYRYDLARASPSARA